MLEAETSRAISAPGDKPHHQIALENALAVTDGPKSTRYVLMYQWLTSEHLATAPESETGVESSPGITGLTENGRTTFERIVEGQADLEAESTPPTPQSSVVRILNESPQPSSPRIHQGGSNSEQTISGSGITVAGASVVSGNNNVIHVNPVSK